MTRPAKILLMCADEPRAVAVREALQEVRPGASFEAVTNLESLDRALASADSSLVLAIDPIGGPLPALCARIAAAQPQLPIIAITPELEETAIEAGAWDVLSDERGPRLRRAVNRALRQTDDRLTAETVLHEREERDRELVSERHVSEQRHSDQQARDLTQRDAMVELTASPLLSGEDSAAAFRMITELQARI